LEQALEEARNYAGKINNSSVISVKFITGVAGNDNDSYLIKSAYYDGNEFKPITINDKEITGFLPPDEARTILRTNNPHLADMPINIKLFISKAEKINEILHLGAVLPNRRAEVMSALLLSMLDDTPPNIDALPSVLISDINSRALSVLRQQGRPEFHEYIKISLPLTEDNHLKFRNALVAAIQELHILDIRSAMNSGHDVLGHFYEVFLKYANWAKDLGIVLTPRHITQFVAEVMDINLHDIVYDPCCGTGGFLVAALDYVKKNYTADQVNDFKQNSIFGVEQDPGVASLAVVNMIFRGDGKNNIMEGNSFSKFLSPSNRNGARTAKFTNSSSKKPPITKVLMNPPFALKSDDEKEYKFIDQALKQMEDGSILFSVLAYPVMVKGGGYLNWRKVLLESNTLLAVITFPPDLFYPIGVHTLGIFVKKGIPHSPAQNVLWIKAMDDGLTKSKGKRLPESGVQNDLKKVKDVLRAFLVNPQYNVENVLNFQKACPMDCTDKMLELVPEAYLDDALPTKEEMNRSTDQLIREAVAFLITNHDYVEKNIDIISNNAIPKKSETKDILQTPCFKAFKISDLGDIKPGTYHATKKELEDGKCPLISCGEYANGLIGHYDIPSQHQFSDTLTIAYNGKPLTTRFHPYGFGAKDDVAVFINNMELKPTTLIFIGMMINAKSWRFSYGRKCFNRKLEKQTIFLPVNEEELNEEYMEKIVINSPFWKYLEKHITNSPQKT